MHEQVERFIAIGKMWVDTENVENCGPKIPDDEVTETKEHALFMADLDFQLDALCKLSNKQKESA